MIFSAPWQDFLGRDGNVFVKSTIPMSALESFLSSSNSTIAQGCSVKGEVVSLSVNASSADDARDVVLGLMSRIAFHNVTGLSYRQSDASVPENFYLTPSFPCLKRVHLWHCPIDETPLLMCDSETELTRSRVYSWAFRRGFQLIHGDWRNASLHGPVSTHLLTPINPTLLLSGEDDDEATGFGEYVSRMLRSGAAPEWSKLEMWRFAKA